MGVSFGYFRFQSAMLLFQLCEMRVNRHPNPPFLIAATVIFGPNEPPGSSLPRWATVKGVPNYRKAGVRGFMRSVPSNTREAKRLSVGTFPRLAEVQEFVSIGGEA